MARAPIAPIAPIALCAHAFTAGFFVGAWWLSHACACAAIWQPLFVRRHD